MSNPASWRETLKDYKREVYCDYLSWRSFFDGASEASRQHVNWLFILTFPNGGSTALAKLLLTSPSTVSLTPNAEGQWLIPSMTRARDRWDENYSLSYRKVRAVWLDQVRKKTSGPCLVVEKSPPNMVRYDKLLSSFDGMKTDLITFTRDPYAVCASWHKRYDTDEMISNWSLPCDEGMSEFQRFENLAEIWLRMARYILAAQPHARLNLRYEDFTADVPGAAKSLSSEIEMLSDISLEAKVKVKDYPDQKIINMNDRQISRLSDEQRAGLTSGLSKDRDTLDALHYQIL